MLVGMNQPTAVVATLQGWYGEATNVAFAVPSRLRPLGILHTIVSL